ncbi:tyrosinase 2 [Ophiocordyceps sinensis CO18]|uniref:Tyrosinase 2 n=1 Tax=Ophiocordyceps sinensis (strain Co18 / CGMCC 3.14243) TaxID=911162 RepID=T5AK82_OPHSC|nr:tyrosinase 2 [Ophiocordyceps sinensis CO18]
MAAADSLRAPYWDWAATSKVPESTVPRRVTINTAQGRREVENPLASYAFPREALDGQFGTFSPQPSRATERCPAPESYPESANKRLMSDSLGELVYDAFIYATGFDDFGSTSGNGVSLEQVHNMIHNDAACGQVMSIPSYAGFEPLFMLHHSNVDRLWAYWQAIHPDQASFTRPYRGGPRFTTPEGTLVTPSSPMIPFFDAGGLPLTPDSVSSIRGLGYTYENLEYWRMSDEEMRRQATRLVNERYSSRAGEPDQNDDDRNDGRDDDRNDGRNDDQDDGGPVEKRAPADTTRNENYKGRKVFLAHVSLLAEDVERPAVIELFLCNKYLGNIPIMEVPMSGTINATIPMAKAIQACRHSVPKLSHLKNDMAVRIVTRSGKEIPLSSISSMKMDLEDLEEIPADSIEEFPTIRNRHRSSARLRQYFRKQFGLD